MVNRPSLPICHRASARVQLYRVVKLMIKRLINLFKAYHKFPLNIASDARTKALSGRGALPAHILPAINRNVANNVNSHGVSNFASVERLIQKLTQARVPRSRSLWPTFR